MSTDPDACASCGSEFAPGASSCRKCGLPRDATVVGPRNAPASSRSRDQTEPPTPAESQTERYHAPATAQSSAEAESCAVCGASYAPGAMKCRKCAWPRGVATVAEKNSEESYSRLGSRLQELVVSTANIAQVHPSQLESRLEIRPGMGGSEMCESTMSVLEDLVSQVRGRMPRGQLGMFEDTMTNASDFSSDRSVEGCSSRIGEVAWQPNRTNCQVCGGKLGKRRMNPRHHCRACGKCVCSNCSPSVVQLTGSKTMMRVCTPCVSGAFPAARNSSMTTPSELSRSAVSSAFPTTRNSSSRLSSPSELSRSAHTPPLSPPSEWN